MTAAVQYNQRISWNNTTVLSSVLLHVLSAIILNSCQSISFTYTLSSDGSYSIHNAHIPGGEYTGGLVTWDECVSSCMAPCVAADFDKVDQSCWLHYGSTLCSHPTVYRPNVDHFRNGLCGRHGSMLPSSSANDIGYTTTYPLGTDAYYHTTYIPLASFYPPSPVFFHSSSDYLPKSTSHRRLLESTPPRCGKPVVSPSGGRIIGGQESRPGSWPWQVALRNKNARSSRCAGTLIDRQWILTTAHCVDQDMVPSNWLILTGAHDLLAVESARLAHSVAEIILHKDFSLDTFDSDIALLRLSAPVEWGPSASPICLPPEGYKFGGGFQCVVSGWGVATNGRRPLKQAALPVVSMNTCKRKDWLGSEFTLTGNMICAGYEHGGIDTCQGDSGGPLVCYMKDRWVQAGITSFGRGCGLPHKPGVYTNVSKFVNWINSVISKYV